MDNIVKYDNYMNGIRFTNFTQIDMNFFMVLCSMMKNKDTNKICFSFGKLRELTNYKKSNSISQFVTDLKRMNEKLMRVACHLDSQDEILMFVLFPTFRINPEKQVLTVSVNEDFKFILNELTKNFTRFDLKEFIGLDSKYSKNLYRLLKQYRSTGYYEVAVDKLKEYMDCPDSYNNKQFMQNIINPTLKNLQDYFQNLKCEPKYASKRGKPITGYIFTFTPESNGKPSGYSQKKGKTAAKAKKTKNSFTNFHQREYARDEIESALRENPHGSAVARTGSRERQQGQQETGFLEPEIEELLK